MKRLAILFTFSATLYYVPVAMADCLDECIDRNYDHVSTYRNYGAERADEEDAYWFDQCWNYCAAKFSDKDTPKERTVPREPDSKPTAEVREYWGAYVEAGKYWERGEVVGVSWDHPSPEEALNRAIKECLKQPRCVDIHEYDVFSTSLEKGYDYDRSDVFHTDYGNIEAGLSKNLCIALGCGGGDCQEAYGATKYEARENFLRLTAEDIVFAEQCQKK